MTFGKRLREKRLECGFTQAELGTAICSSNVMVSSYERDDKVPGIDVLRRICVALDVTSDWLLGLSSEEPLRLELLDERDRCIVRSLYRFMLGNG